MKIRYWIIRNVTARRLEYNITHITGNNSFKYVLKYVRLVRDNKSTLFKITFAGTLKSTNVFNSLLRKYKSVYQYAYIKIWWRKNYDKSQKNVF